MAATPAAARPRLACALAAAIVLSACETTRPPVVAVEGSRSVHALREEPHLAAICIARNVDRLRTPYSAQIAPGIAPIVVEVHVRGHDPIATAQLSVAAEGSRASIWLTPERFYERDEFIGAIIAGC